MTTCSSRCGASRSPRSAPRPRSRSSPPRGAKTVRAELRVLTPTRVLDPGTTYLTARAGHHRPGGGLQLRRHRGGAGFELTQPTALGLLPQRRARTRTCAHSVTDEFGFGQRSARSDRSTTRRGPSGTQRNHAELSVGADQEPIANGDEFLVYLAPDNFPA